MNTRRLETALFKLGDALQERAIGSVRGDPQKRKAAEREIAKAFAIIDELSVNIYLAIRSIYILPRGRKRSSVLRSNHRCNGIAVRESLLDVALIIDCRDKSGKCNIEKGNVYADLWPENDENQEDSPIQSTAGNISTVDCESQNLVSEEDTRELLKSIGIVDKDL